MARAGGRAAEGTVNPAQAAVIVKALADLPDDLDSGIRDRAEAHLVEQAGQFGPSRTDLADGVLLCSWHHHRAHDPRYGTRRHPHGDLTFHRRT